MSDAMRAETVSITGARGDEIEAYLAQPLDGPPAGGVVVIHHMPGYDEGTKEITRRFAAHHYLAICPNLYSREAPGASPDDAAAVVRAQGGVPDDRQVDAVGGAAAHLRSLQLSNGKIATIGYCSGGRQSFLAACSLPLQAAVDCYGAFVVGEPPEGLPLKVHPIVDRTPNLSCPPARPLRGGGPAPFPRPGRRARNGARGSGQGVRVPRVRGRRPRVLRRRAPELPASGRQGGLGADLRLLRPPSRLNDNRNDKETAVCTHLTEHVAVRGSGAWTVVSGRSAGWPRPTGPWSGTAAGPDP